MGDGTFAPDNSCNTGAIYKLLVLSWELMCRLGILLRK